MSKSTFKIIMVVITIIGTLAVLAGIDIYSKTIIYHPDAVVTVRNSTTNKNTQAYAIGKMQIYIDQTYRMEMPLWAYWVREQGKMYDPDFDDIQDSGNENLSMQLNNPDNSPAPFILKLKIKNLDGESIYLNAENFKIRSIKNQIYSPNMAWQETLAHAGFFSGAGDQTELKPQQENTLWLVYGTPAPSIEDEGEGTIYQEYVRINYDSTNDLLATKVEFPFNFTADYPIGNYEAEANFAYAQGTVAFLLWLALCGIIYYKGRNKFAK